MSNITKTFFGIINLIIFLLIIFLFTDSCTKYNDSNKYENTYEDVVVEPIVYDSKTDCYDYNLKKFGQELESYMKAEGYDVEIIVKNKDIKIIYDNITESDIYLMEYNESMIELKIKLKNQGFETLTFSNTYESFNNTIYL